MQMQYWEGVAREMGNPFLAADDPYISSLKKPLFSQPEKKVGEYFLQEMSR